jgi:hypothetical protein
MADTTRKANVYEKIFNVQQAIHTVIKGGFNEHFKYKFARERDVTAEVKPLLGKEGLVVTHSLLKDEEIEHGSSSSGAKRYLTKLTFRFRITNIKDAADFVEADAIGYGQDGEDKGAPKAYTMALKYFLSKQFLVETGDDAEQERGGKKAPPEDTFDKAKKMINATRNSDGLMEYAEKLADSKTFNPAQKKELLALCKTRVEALNKKGE